MIEEYLSGLVVSALDVDMAEVVNAARALEEAWRADSSVWIVGNGGSAATASHLANDLVKMARVRAFSLPDMTAGMMAYGNDTGWENMFAGMLDVLMGPGDVLVAISCGGRSENVLRAAEMFGRERRIILTGNRRDTPLGRMEARAKIFVKAEDIRIQEDIHLVVCHVLAGLVAKHG